MLRAPRYVFEEGHAVYPMHEMRDVQHHRGLELLADFNLEGLMNIPVVAARTMFALRARLLVE
jgi:hypothetical protein